MDDCETGAARAQRVHPVAVRLLSSQCVPWTRRRAPNAQPYRGRLTPCEQELKAVFEKLHKYIGKSVEQLVNRSDAPHVFRLHKKVCRRLARAARRPWPLTPPAAASLSSCTTCGKT